VRGTRPSPPIREVCTPSRSLSAAAAEETTLLTKVVAASEKKQRPLLQSERKGSTTEGMAFPCVWLHPKWLHRGSLLTRRNWAVAGTTLSKGVRAISAQVIPPSALTSSNLGKRPDQQAARASSRCRAAGPEVPVVESHYPVPRTLISTLHPTLSVTSRRDSRSPRQPSYQCLHRVDMSASLNVLLPLNKEARPRAVQKTVILFTAEYGSAVSEYIRGKGFAIGWLERWRGSRHEAGTRHILQWVRCRYLPPERDASLVWSRLNVRKPCLPSDRPPDSGRRYSDPCPQGDKPQRCTRDCSIWRPLPCTWWWQTGQWSYFSPIRSFIESDLTECLSGRFPVLMAGDHNAEHPDWNSRLITARDSLLRDYANRWGDACRRACPRKWTEINQSLGGRTGHQGTPAWQGSRSKRYSEQGPDIY
jgi:hypothetical protein